MKSIAVFEPYYGGSHKSFIHSLIDHLPYDFHLHTMPARKWKWRMRMSAPCYVDKIKSNAISLKNIDALFCSPFLDVATFRGLLPDEYKSLPVYTYFHENQFAYPVQVDDERDFHFALTNVTSALASDRIAFNSSYNFESFMSGCEVLLKKNYDMSLGDYKSRILKKSKILYPGMDFSDIDKLQNKKFSNKHPVILWNHRWEHDKNPDEFFKTLYKLKSDHIPYKLVVIGQSFQRVPEIFNQAKEILSDNIIQFGYVKSRSDYIQWLQQSDIVVSTAKHEFFGISIIEAVRAGCYPLLPNRLSYPELFGKEFLYEGNQLYDCLKNLLKNKFFSKQIDKILTEKYSWSELQKSYVNWFGL